MTEQQLAAQMKALAMQERTRHRQWLGHHVNRNPTNEDLQAVDAKVLEQIAKEPGKPASYISTALDMPHTRVRTRLNRLKDIGKIKSRNVLHGGTQKRKCNLWSIVVDKSGDMS